MTVLPLGMEQRMPKVMEPGGGEKGVWPLDNPIILYRPILYGATLIHHSLLSHFTCTICCCTLSWQAGREGVNNNNLNRNKTDPTVITRSAIPLTLLSVKQAEGIAG